MSITAEQVRMWVKWEEGKRAELIAKHGEIKKMDGRAMRQELLGYLNGRKWFGYKWMLSGKGKMLHPAFFSDGTVMVQSDHEEFDVLRQMLSYKREDYVQRCVRAKKAAETRRKRREAKVYKVIERWEGSGNLPGPANKCVICSKKLDDPESIKRGIGSDCWQGMLSMIRQMDKTAA